MNQSKTDIKESILLDNAGLIIVAPFIPKLFEIAGLLNEYEFVEQEARSKAVRLLGYAATGKLEVEEYELVLNKLICGMTVAEKLEENVILNDLDKELVESLLGSVIKQWSKLGSTSIDGLRESFLQRKGNLTEDDGRFQLQVEPKPYDVLLDVIPWSISMVSFKWMKKSLFVSWR